MSGGESLASELENSMRSEVDYPKGYSPMDRRWWHFQIVDWFTVESETFVHFTHKHNFSDSCNIEFIHLTLFVCPIGRKKSYIGIALTICRSVHHENLTLPCILMFLHQTFKLYCLWPEGHNNAKFFRSRSHFVRVLPLFVHGFCHQN